MVVDFQSWASNLTKDKWLSHLSFLWMFLDKLEYPSISVFPYQFAAHMQKIKYTLWFAFFFMGNKIFPSYKSWCWFYSCYKLANIVWCYGTELGFTYFLLQGPLDPRVEDHPSTPRFFLEAKGIAYKLVLEWTIL